MEEKETPAPSSRLAKAIAASGLCSRRAAEALIAESKVTVDGTPVTTPAFTVTPDQVIAVAGKRLQRVAPIRLFLYHKPPGLITTHRDPQGRPTVFDALPRTLPRVVSVGRLDLNSEGLLLLTTSGALARALELPANALPRRYRVRAFGAMTQSMLEAMRKGPTVEGIHYGPMEVSLGENYTLTGRPGNYWLNVTLREGKNREIRRVFAYFDCKVSRLMRMAYGPFELGSLPRAEIKEVPAPKLAAFMKTLHLKSDER
jgi:23S rRNA pseudouridine2605 synthase